MTEASRPNQNKEDLPPGMTLLHTLRGHTSSLNSVAWSPDGQLLASGSADKTLRLWSPTRSVLLDGHTSRVNFVAWSPDGKVLASGSKDSTVRLWNPTTAALLHTLEGHTADIRSLDWSPYGGVLASGSDDATVRLWNSTTGKLLHILKGHTGSVRSVAWSPDGNLIASGSNDTTVRLWNSTTGKCVESLGDSSFDSKVRSVAWSPNGNVLASGYDDLTAKVWGTGLSLPGDQTHQLEGEALTRAVSFIAWSPDGQLLASGGADSSVRVWSPTTGKLLHYLQGHTEEVMSVVWSSDGQLLATSSSTGKSLEDAEVRIWRTDIWEPLAVLKDLKGCINVSWHPRFSILVTAGYQAGDILIWHFDLARLFHMAPSPETVHYTNAKVILVGDSGVGKSGLALVLTNQPFAPTDSTHGRHVWLFDRQEVQAKDRPHEMRDIWLWDLAGQPDYRLIHQLHLHEATIALIVFDATRETDSFSGIRYWHRALRHAQQARGPAALPLTIFLVAARIDRGSLSMSRVRLNTLAQELGCAGYIETSAKDGRGIPELSQAISSAIHWTSLPRITSTQLLQAIKLFVLSEQHTGQILYTVNDLYNAFLSSPNASVPSDELRRQFETALGFLESQGGIRWLSFGNMILLQPERLDAYASALLIAVKDEPDGLGSILEARVLQGQFLVPREERLSNLMTEKLLLIAMVEELVRNQLVLREGGFLLFPSQSTREYPERAALENKSIITFSFAGPVLSIYTTLVVRLAQCGIFQKQDLWQNVATYTTKLGGIYGLFLSPRGEEQAELGLVFDDAVREEMCFHFEVFISAHLERQAEGPVQRRRRFACPSCGFVVTDQLVQLLSQQAISHFPCPVCHTDISLLDGTDRLASSISSHVQQMEQAADSERNRESVATIRQGKAAVQEANRPYLLTTKKAVQQINIYISSASTPQDEMLLDELEKQLSVLRRQPKLYLWEKRLIAPGANWEQEISTYVNQAHLILFLVSPDFFASDQCYGEMELAIRRVKAREVFVIPLLMRHTADWEDTPLGMLEPLPADRRPVSDRADQERAMSDIAKRIRQIIEKIREELTDSGQ